MLLNNIKIIRGSNINTEVFDFEELRANHGLTLIINDFNFDANLNIKYSPNTNTRGGKLGRTLSDGRLYSFSGSIWGNTNELNAAQIILRKSLAFKTQAFTADDEIYVLEFDLDDGVTYQSYVKTYKLPSFKLTDDGSIMDFTFELISPTFEYWRKEPTILTNTVSLGGATSYNIKIDTLTEHMTEFTPLIISLKSSSGLVNPEIENLTTLKRYQTNTTIGASDYYYTNFDKGMPVISYGSLETGSVFNNLAYYRDEGSSTIYLEPGDVNNIRIKSDVGLGNLFYKITYYPKQA